MELTDNRFLHINQCAGPISCELTVSHTSKVWEYTISPAAAWCGERGLAGVVTSKIEKILELRRSKIETGKAVITLTTKI